MLTKVKRARLERGIPQKELAQRTGIHRPTLSAIEAGKINPGPEIAEKIGKVLGVPADWLVER